jgi:hypothetical protein
LVIPEDDDFLAVCELDRLMIHKPSHDHVIRVMMICTFGLCQVICSNIYWTRSICMIIYEYMDI